MVYTEKQSYLVVSARSGVWFCISRGAKQGCWGLGPVFGGEDAHGPHGRKKLKGVRAERKALDHLSNGKRGRIGLEKIKVAVTGEKR